MELDKSVLAAQLEVTYKNMHEMSILVKNLQAEKALLEQHLDEEKQRSSSRQEYINALKVSDKLPNKVQKQPSGGVLRKRCSDHLRKSSHPEVFTFS